MFISLGSLWVLWFVVIVVVVFQEELRKQMLYLQTMVGVGGARGRSAPNVST